VRPAQDSSAAVPQDILIVASKLKDYIRAKSGMNTSGPVMEKLSEMVRRHCDRAILEANRDGRKTVMDRDFS
jgi:histone H3/H4